MPKYLSGRVKRTGQAYLSTDRYQYLGLEQAEPNLADPPAGGTSPNIPVGQRSQIISVQGFPGERFWVPVEGGLIPGAISVFEEGTLVGGSSSTTQLDIRGNIITAIGNRTGLSNPGVAVTLSVDPPGTDGQLLFNKNGDFGGATLFNYDDSTVGVASVGIGTTAPTQNLHILGNLRLENSFFDATNFSGNQGQLLVRNASGGLEYANAATVPTGAGGTFGNVQFHDDTGLVDGASNFVYIETDERVGIGSTQPKVLLDVVGIASFTDLTIAGVLTASQEQGGLDFETDVRFEGANYNAEWDISQSALEFEDNAKAKFGTDLSKELEIFFDGTHSKIDHTSTTGSLFLAGDSLVLSNSGMSQYYLQAAENGSVLLNYSGITKFQTAETGAIVTGIFTATQEIQADKITTIDNNFVNIDVSGIATMGNIDTNFIDAENIDVGFATVTDKLDVTGITTTKNIFAAGIGTFLQIEVDNLKIDGNKIESTTGNLILESATTTITANDVFFVNNSDDSTSKDSGSIITQGGIGVEKSLFVGNNLSVVGFTTLASAGGITTTGGDLYVGGDLFVNDDIALDNIKAGSVFVSGISTFIGLSTFNSGIEVVSGLSTFRGNIFVATGATVGFGDSIFIPDNKKISLGDNKELEIFYGQSPNNPGSTTQNSYIRDAGTGDLVILSNQVAIKNAAETEDMATFYESGQVELRYADSLKFETTNEGVKINGITSMTGNLKVGQYVESDLTPSAETFDLGESGKSWQKLYIKEIIGTDKIGVDETTIGLLKVTGIATIATLGVTGLTTTKDLIVTGLSTFKGKSHFESNVGIGTTNPYDPFDGGFEKRFQVVSGGVEPYLFSGGEFLNAEDILSVTTKSGYGGFNINVRNQNEDNPTWTVRTFANEPIAFAQGTSEIARFNSDGNLGIGTTNPGLYKLHVKSPIATIARFERTTDAGGGSWAKVDIKSGTSSGNSYLTFSDVDATEIGAINYEHNNDSLIFNVNGSDRVIIDSDGHLLRNSATGVNGNQDIGETTYPWRTVYAQEFKGILKTTQTNFDTGSLNVTGLSTFGDTVDINASVQISSDIDVDGHTYLDNLSVSGISTFTGQIKQTASGSNEAKITLNNESDTVGMDVGYSESNGLGFIDVGQSGSGLSIKTGGTANSDERIRITSVGKVGINEDNPQDMLHVFHATDNIIARFESGDSGVGIRLKDNTHRTQIKTQNGGLEIDVDNNNQLSSQSLSIQFAGSEKLNINNDGDLLRGGTGQDIGANGAPWDKVYANEFIGQINVTQSELTVTNLDVTGIATFREEVQFLGNNYDVKWDHDNNEFEFADNAKITFGNAGGTPDLQIYHSSSENNSYIQDTGSGALVITGTEIQIKNSADDEDLAKFTQDTGVKLYDGASQLRLNTSNTGVSVTGELVTGTAKVSNLTDGRVVLAGSQGKLEDSGNLTFNGSKLTINGDLLVTGDATYEGVTNIDSVGIVTAGRGFRATTGGLIISSGISTFSDVIRPQHGNNENSGIQWANDIGSGSGDRGFIRYYVESGENTRLEIACRNDSDDDIYLNTRLVNVSDDMTIDKNLVVNGNTTLGNATGDTVTFTARVNSDIYPSLNAADSDPPTTGYDLGGSNNQWRKVFAREFSGAVTGNADTASRLATPRNIAITGDLTWNVDFDGNDNVTGEGTLETTGVTADTYGSATQIPRITVDAKGRITAATTNGFDLTGATAAVANKIKVNNTDDDSTHYLAFISQTGNMNEKDVFIDGELTYNPNTNILSTRDIYPTTDDTYNLGQSDSQRRWNNIYAKHFRGGTFYGTIDASVSAFSLASSVEDVFSVASNILSADTSPSSDKIIFYDHSAGKLTHLTAGDNLTINGVQLNATNTDTNTVYTLPVSHTGTNSNATSVSLNLTDNNGGVDAVTITKGNGVTFSSVGTGGFTISANDQAGTTYNLGTRTDPKIRLAGSDGTNDDITLVGQEGITLSSTNSVNGGTINISGSGVVGTTYNLQVPENTTNIELQGTTTDTNINRVAIVGGNNVTVVRTANNILTINGTAAGLALQNENQGTYRNIVFASGSGDSTLRVNDNGRLRVRSSDGELRVNGDVVAFSSDDRVKTNKVNIDNAVDKVKSLNGFTFKFNEIGKSLGYDMESSHAGVSAQEVQKILPEAVTTRLNDEYLTVKYDKLVPLLIEAIKELKDEIDELKSTK